jgi:hypothetical protein
MAKLRRLTGGRAWVARALVLLPVALLVGLTLAILPASAADPSASPETGNGVQPLEVGKAGPDRIDVCDFAEAELGLDPDTVSAYAYDNNPQDGDVLAILDGDGAQLGEVHISRPGTLDNPDYGSQSMEFEVRDGDGNPSISDYGLESARKVQVKQENLSLSFWCFTTQEGELGSLVSVSVDGSKATNLYSYLLECGGTTGVQEAGEYVAEFILLDTEGCVPKSVYFSVSASEVTFEPPGGAGDNVYVGTITRPFVDPDDDDDAHTQLQISEDGSVWVPIQWAIPGSVTFDSDGDVSGFDCPDSPPANHPEGWCALFETSDGVTSIYTVGGEGIDPKLR